MVICRSQNYCRIDPSPLFDSLKRFEFFRIGAVLAWLLLLIGVVCAQDTTAEEKVVVVNGITNSTVFGMGETLKITGTVKQGAMSFGGDVIVEGVVEGDVATIGGSVIQLPGSRIGGDVIVLGGTYQSGDPAGSRNPASMTMMYAGYEQELRNIMRNPSGLLSLDGHRYTWGRVFWPCCFGSWSHLR